MTKEDFLRLVRFYLACIEAEDRRSLTKRLSGLHRSLVSPWDAEELLFHPEGSEITCEAHLRSDHKPRLLGACNDSFMGIRSFSTRTVSYPHCFSQRSRWSTAEATVL